jgi:hypothetical protein
MRTAQLSGWAVLSTGTFYRIEPDEEGQCAAVEGALNVRKRGVLLTIAHGFRFCRRG